MYDSRGRYVVREKDCLNGKRGQTTFYSCASRVSGFVYAAGTGLLTREVIEP